MDNRILLQNCWIFQKSDFAIKNYIHLYNFMKKMVEIRLKLFEIQASEIRGVYRNSVGKFQHTEA